MTVDGYRSPSELAGHADRLDDLSADEANAYVAAHDLGRFVSWRIEPGGVGDASDRLRWVALTS